MKLSLTVFFGAIAYLLIACGGPSNPTPTPFTTRQIAKIQVTSGAAAHKDIPRSSSVEPKVIVRGHNQPQTFPLVSAGKIWLTASEITAGQYQQCVNAGVCSAVVNGDEFCSWVGMRKATQDEISEASQKGLLLAPVKGEYVGIHCAQSAVDQ